MYGFSTLPQHIKEQLMTSCLISSELSQPLVSSIQRELGESTIDVLNRLPTKEWMLAGGFMAYIAGHTKCYGDIDVFLYKYIRAEELGSEWIPSDLLREDSWLYTLLDVSRFQGSTRVRFIVYDHRYLKLQLIIPLKRQSESFLQYCSNTLMRFDVEYVKLGWIGTSKMIMDLRGFTVDHPIQKPLHRQDKYSRRLINKKLPIPKLSLLLYMKCIQVKREYYVRL